MKNYVIINTEENDFLKGPFDDTSLIKLEAIKIDKNFNEQDRFFEYIKPKKELSKEIEDLTGITNTMLKEKGISLKEALEKFLDFIKDSWIIGYHTDYEISIILKGIYETKIEDYAINIISLRDYIKYKTDLRKKVKSLNFDNVVNYYNIKYNDLEKEWLDITISLLKILVKKENVETIEDFKEKNIPKFLFPGLSKRDAKWKVRFYHGEDEFAIRKINFIDKTPDRKVSYLIHYNFLWGHDITFYELALFKKWGVKTIDDFSYINDINIDYIDYYFIKKDIDLSKEKKILENLKNNISCLDKCERNLRYDGTLKELKKEYKILGEDNLKKIIAHVKIKKEKK